MDGSFWLGYGILAGLALGLSGVAIGILVVRQRFGARRSLRLGTTRFTPQARR